MKTRLDRRDFLRLGLGAGALTLLSACDTTGFGMPSFASLPLPIAPKPPAAQDFGKGPTKVALLLPLTGDEASPSLPLPSTAATVHEYVVPAARPASV